MENSSSPQAERTTTTLERWLEDPLAARLIRALVDGNSAPIQVGEQTQLWATDDAPLVVLVRVDGRDQKALGDALALLLSRLGSEPIDVVLLGGSAEHRATLRALLAEDTSASHPRGAAHIDERGERWSATLSPTIASAIDREFERTDAAPLDPPTRDALAERVRSAAKQRAERAAEAKVFRGQLEAAARPTVTYVLLAAIVAVFVAQLAYRVDSLSTAVRMGALVRERVVSGELYRLLSYSFVHGSFNHVLMNGLSLLSLGAFYERVLGRGRFSLVYFAGALAGGVCAALFGKASVVVGASGAIFALIGASVALAIKPRGALPEATIADFRKSAVGNLALQVFVSLMPNVSLAAHAGGFLAGLLLVLSGVAHPGDEPIEERSDRLSLVGRGAIVSLFIAGAMGLALGRVWTRDNPDRWSTYRLAATSLEVRAPRVPVAVGTHTAERREWTLAEIRDDDMSVGMVFGAYPMAATEELLDSTAREFVEQTTPMGAPSGARSLGAPTRSMLNGLHRIEQSSAMTTGVTFRNTILLRRDGLVSVQAVYREADAMITAAKLQRILESLAR